MGSKFKAGDRVIWEPPPHIGLKAAERCVILEVPEDGDQDYLVQPSSRRDGDSRIAYESELKLEADPKNEKFSTGAQRDRREGKGRFDLIPPEIERAIAQGLEKGAKKYGERNWEKGQPLARILDSLKRHLNQFAAGEDDEDHLENAACNMAFLVAIRERVRRGKLPASLVDIGTPVLPGDMPAGTKVSVGDERYSLPHPCQEEHDSEGYGKEEGV